MICENLRFFTFWPRQSENHKNCEKSVEKWFFRPRTTSGACFFRTRGVFGKIRKKRTTEVGHHGVIVGKNAQENGKEKTKKQRKERGYKTRKKISFNNKKLCSNSYC